MIRVCVFGAWGSVLELCVVLVHKLAQKVPTCAQQSVCGVADGMKCVLVR